MSDSARSNENYCLRDEALISFLLILVGSGNDVEWPTWSREAPITLQVGIGAQGQSVLNVEKTSELDAAKMEFWLTKFGKVGL